MRWRPTPLSPRRSHPALQKRHPGRHPGGNNYRPAEANLDELLPPAGRARKLPCRRYRGIVALERKTIVAISTILLIVLILLLIGALPTWPYSSGWSYRPSGMVGLIIVLLLVFLLAGVV